MQKKIKLAVLGAGRWGPNLIRNFSSSAQAEVVCISDKNQARLSLLAEKYPGISLTEDAESAIHRSDVDAVVICTPTETHFDLSRKALLSGKHVFVEKPLAQTGDECQQLVDLAKQKKLTLFVGHIFVYNAGIQAARDLIQSGELGKIFYIHATRTNLGPIRTDVNALWDLSPHDISILNFWLKKVPESVTASGACYLNKNIEDVVFSTYYYPDNITANVHVSWLNPQKIRQFLVVGEKKMLLWDDMDLQKPIKIFDKRVSAPDISATAVVDTFMGFRTSIVEGETFIPRVALNEPLKEECEAFLQAIRDPASSKSTGVDGLAVVKVLEATTESLRNQSVRTQVQL